MTGIHLHDRPTAVYRLYGANAVLLYVGITCDPKMRLSNHRVNKPWWPDAQYAELEWFSTRKAARSQESKAIAWEVPQHNVSRPHVRHDRPVTTATAPVEPTEYAGIAVRGLTRPFVPDDFDVIRAAWRSCCGGRHISEQHAV